jgi:hypothetical protein
VIPLLLCHLGSCAYLKKPKSSAEVLRDGGGATVRLRCGGDAVSMQCEACGALRAMRYGAVRCGMFRGQARPPGRDLHTGSPRPVPPASTPTPITSLPIVACPAFRPRVCERPEGRRLRTTERWRARLGASQPVCTSARMLFEQTHESLAVGIFEQLIDPLLDHLPGVVERIPLRELVVVEQEMVPSLAAGMT